MYIVIVQHEVDILHDFITLLRLNLEKEKNIISYTYLKESTNKTSWGIKNVKNQFH